MIELNIYSYYEKSSQSYPYLVHGMMKYVIMVFKLDSFEKSICKSFIGPLSCSLFIFLDDLTMTSLQKKCSVKESFQINIDLSREVSNYR